MSSALNSLDTSLSHFNGNEYGLGVTVQYIESKTSTTHENIRLTRQYKEGSSKARKIVDGKQIDLEVFLITLPFKPTKNDKILFDSSIYYVDTYEIVTSTNFRLYCEAGAETVPSPTKRLEI